MLMIYRVGKAFLADIRFITVLDQDLGFRTPS